MNNKDFPSVRAVFGQRSNSCGSFGTLPVRSAALSDADPNRGLVPPGVPALKVPTDAFTAYHGQQPAGPLSAREGNPATRYSSGSHNGRSSQPPSPRADLRHAADPHYVREYMKDIMDSLFRAEGRLDRQLYMPVQPDISEKMRMILIDWLIEVHLKFKCRHETLFLAVDVVDRYLMTGNRTSRSMLQLVGVTSMLLAAKYEEIWPPEVKDCVYISANTYTREEILKMERGICQALGFKLTLPNVMHFLSRLLDVSEADTVSRHLAYYFAETSLLHYQLLTCKPSIVAAACVVLANVTQRAAEPWTPTLRHYARCSLTEASDVAKRLLEFTHTVAASKYTAIVRKYSVGKFNEVSKMPLPTPDQLPN